MIFDDLDRKLDEWATDMRARGRSPHTIRNYVSDVRRYGGQTNYPARAEAIRESGLAPRTIARHMAAHTAFIKFASMNPLQAASIGTYFQARPSVGIVLPRVVPEVDEMKALIAAEPDPMWRALWAVMAGCGLRVSEALGLTWRDLTLVKATGVVRVFGKGGKVRDVPMSTGVTKELLAWYELPSRPKTRPVDFSAIFPVSAREAQRQIKIAAVRAGLPDTWHPHALRHGFATAVQEAEHDIRLTADLLGHSSVSTTMIYTHVRDERRVRAVAGVI